MEYRLRNVGTDKDFWLLFPGWMWQEKDQNLFFCLKQFPPKKKKDGTGYFTFKLSAGPVFWKWISEDRNNHVFQATMLTSMKVKELSQLLFNLYSCPSTLGGSAENIANSAQLKLKLELSLAIFLGIMN